MSSGLASEKSLDIRVASKKIVKDKKFHMKLFALPQCKSPWPEQPGQSVAYTKVLHGSLVLMEFKTRP